MTEPLAHPGTEDGLPLADVVLAAGRSRHAFEDCVERLATALRLGVYRAGTVLPPERDLAARMGVSRSTVRQAIAALRSAGLVSTVRGRGGGTVVEHRPSEPAEDPASLAGRAAELSDALVFRRVVEPGAAEVAAGRPLPQEHRRLVSEALEQVATAGEAGEHRQADSRLHLAIALVTGSALIVEAVTRVQRQLHDMLTAIPSLPVNLEHSDAQHADIVAAILAGNARRARRAMEDHCDDTAALLRGLLVPTP